VVGSKAVESNVDRQSNTDLYQQLLDTTKSRNQSFEALFLTLSVPAAWVNYFVASMAFFFFGLYVSFFDAYTKPVRQNTFD
jgi:hypothetical protein